MNRHAEEILKSILEEFATRDRQREDLEAKSIFKILNYCPPDYPVVEKPASRKLSR